MSAEHIEDIYELSPMQRGMLFHTLYAPHSGVYIEQAIYDLRGPLDVDILHETWQRVLVQHPTLRTAFLWEELDDPVQVVYQEARVSWEQRDWRADTPDVQYRQLDALLAADRRRGFDLAAPPLLRLALIYIGHEHWFLLITHHHLLLDGWSLSIVFRETLDTYRQLSGGQEPHFKIRRPYRDYILWLRQQNLAAAEEYWRHYLQGFTVPTSLWYSVGATEAEDIATRSEVSEIGLSVAEEAGGDLRLRGGRPVALQGFILPIETTTALRAFARRHQLTLNTLVQGAWALLLSRLSGEEDVLFGATVAGRPSELVGAEAMVGLFINTLPVRVEVSAQAFLLPWLAQLQQQQAEARQYDYSPLVQVQGWSEIERGQQLFESLVVFENYHVEQKDELNTTTGSIAARGDIQVEALQFLEQTNYPLVLIIGPGSALEIQLGYETARFAPEAIQHLLAYIRTLMEGFMAQSESRLLDISLLNSMARQQLLSRWSQPAHALLPSVTLHYCFQQRAARNPDALALVYQEQSLTYGELERRANQLARVLHQRGVGPEVLVGLCMERSLEMVIGLLAILKAGGGYVPLDPAYPEERVTFILQDTQAALVLTQQKLAAGLLQLSPQPDLLCIDAEAEVISQQSATPPETQGIPANTAYIIYTSGTTGLPKGVMVAHRSLVNHAMVMGVRYRIQSSDRVLQFAPIAFDVGIEELFPSWLQGASVILWPEMTAPTPDEFSRFVVREQLTVLNLPSSYWHAWVTELARPLAMRPSALRAMIVGSEKVLATHVARWYDLMGQQVFWYNAYGLTETTVTSLLYELAGQLTATPFADVEGWGDVPLPGASLRGGMPIGQPVANTEAYVLDACLQPVPPGMPGELYIGGSGLARGYWRQPGMTAERFVPHPFSVSPGARLYRTGDRVRYRADGTIALTGRIDAQVKIRGFRVEPTEVEAVLSRHGAVSDVVVLAREDKPGETRLVAYIVAKRHTPQLANTLRAYVQTKLPSYMVPGVFVLLKALPRAASGKINPRLLPAPENVGQTGEAYSAPRTPVEEILAIVWANVLQLERVGRYDQFFRLGGHSLQATQVVARLREVLHIDLPVRSMYDAPTIIALAATIEKLKQGEQSQPVPPLERVARTGDNVFPLSFAQQRLWFLDQLQPGSPYYTIPGAFSIKGPLDVEALEHSLNTLVQRHETLRTTFTLIDEQPVQVVAAQLHISLPVIALEIPMPEPEIARLVRAEARRPFDLEHGPLLRATVIHVIGTGNGFPTGLVNHILLLTLHHIVADGWSADIFFQELQLVYAACVSGRSPDLPDLAIQYTDYALWQRGWLRGTMLEEQLAYWRTQLSDLPPLLDIPTDYPRPALQTFEGAMSAFALSADLTLRLKALSQQEGVTLFMLLLAAFQVLLSRYSGQDDIAVGTPIAGRTRIQTERLIGFFVNTLVIRSDLSGNPGFRDLLARVRETALDAYMHQDLPFERLVAELAPQRSLSHLPLFQILFMLQRPDALKGVSTPELALEANTGTGAHPARIEKGGRLSLEPLGMGTGTAKFDLTFDLLETPQGLEGVMEYNTTLFAAATIERMLSHYTTLLEGIVSNVEQPIALLPLLTVSERQQMLIAWNATRFPPGNDASLVRQTPGACLHQLFEAQAARNPDSMALLFDEQCITYGELDERANRLAHCLQHLGVGPDVKVGLCLERSLALIVGVLGILKAGGAYVPLDSRYPAQRLAFLLADTGMLVLLTERKLLASLPIHDVRILCLDSDWHEIASWPATCPQSNVDPEHLAYVIYTSGSTGTPKGVAMPHAALVNLCLWQQRSSALPSDARTLQFASLSFDVASQEIFSTLVSGQTLVLLSEPVRRDPDALLHLLVEQAISRLFLPVVALQQLAEVAAYDTRTPFMLGTTLQEVTTAGEQLQITPAILSLFERLPTCQLVNQYGPSESHVVSAYRLAEPPAHWPTLPAIGTPVANTELYVLDAFLQPVPIGIVGELYIGGRGLARGYLHRADITAERFIPHPFSSLPGARLYRTGDLAHYFPNSNLQFMGRGDYQVKLRGFRVEPGEIEAVLARHPAVHEVVVVLREEQNDKYLVAYVVTKERPVSSLHVQLRNYLQEYLPDYMIPSCVVVLDTLPLTAHGKVDRRSLPAPVDSVSDAPGHTSRSARATPLEAVLIAIWSDLLHREYVEVEDNFFDLGGHSLLATRLVARIHDTLQLSVPLRTIFEAPTIAALAAWIERANRNSDTTLSGTARVAPRERVPLLRRSTEGTHLPLSYAQERLWFLHQLDPDSPAYTLALALELLGELDIQALERSLNILVQRHEALRTTFPVIDGIPWQLIAAEQSITLTLRDFSHDSPSLRRQQVELCSTEECERPFDLSRGPLLCATLLRLSEQEHRLLLTFHHSITDAWSMGILFNELSTVYVDVVHDAQSGELPSDLSAQLVALPVQYADYALWQRDWLQGEVLEQQAAYWRKQLWHCPTLLNLPVDYPRPPVQSYRGDACPFLLPVALSQQISALSRQQATTPFMTLLAALQVLLFRYCGQTDMVIGTPVAGRLRSELEGVVGLFVNTLALRTDLSGDPSFLTLLKRVREVCLQAYSRQDMPFEKVVEVVQPERSLSHHPLFQVMFMLQNAPGGDVTLPGLQVRSLPLGAPTTKFDLTVECIETPAGLRGVVEYNSDLFERATIERLIQHYQQLLQAIVRNPGHTLSSFPLLGEAELHRLLREWNTTQAEVPTACAHQLFEAQVLRTPDAVALRYEECFLTFADLDQRANQLAHTLRARGVKPEVCVGIYMARSPELIIGVLGVLKAGGAYLPLDQQFPAARLAFMLEETQALIVLTQRQLRDRLPAQSAQLFCLDSDWPALAAAEKRPLTNTATLNNLAYIMYTSGSTGRPKGVLIEHRGLTNYLSWCLEAYAVEQGQGTLLHSSLASDLTITSLFAPLLAGQPLILLPEELGLDALGVALSQSEDLSLVKLTPAHLSLLAEQLATRDVSGRTRVLIIGGEALLREHLTFWQEHAPSTRLINEYGPTETVVGCCVYEATNVPEQSGSEPALTASLPVPIGRPIANMRLYLLDRRFQSVPIGIPGEIFIGGPGVARGYLQRSELTAERFLPDPFSREPGARLYRTGDMARYLPDGKIVFSGRNDAQIKLRGYRIELAEIESVLREHSTVREAAVVFAQQLVAYVVCPPDTTASASQLRSFLRERLPDYMLPTYYVMLREMPLSANGKLDRLALLQFVHTTDLADSAQGTVGREPASPLEETLVEIWKQVLGREKISIDDNFFDLGGHSLLVTQVVSRVRQLLQVELPLRTLFEKSTIADLADAIIQQELEQADGEELQRLLAEMDDLATDEV